jgi:uncharacterized protein YndB with AHSA1/START domain
MTREISAEIEVPGTPEEVWEAIATGPGISAWFVSTEIADGKLIQHHGGGFDDASEITASEPPRRFAYADDFQPSEDAEPSRVATEFLVEARSGDSCVVRVVQSGFGTGDAWERAIESFESGWPGALDDLRLYLTHFAGQPVAGFSIGRPLDVSREQGWPVLREALGLPGDAAVGDRVATHGTPPYGGTVARVSDGYLSFLLDEPGPGLGFLGAGGPGDAPVAFVRARYFGDHAAAIAAREETAWEEWFSRLQPARRDPATAPGHAAPRR